MSPFDWHAMVLAKHAQHVVLIHFPIALYVTAVGLDVLAQLRKKPEWETAVFLNLTVAALFTVPAILTGVIAWQWQLEGQRIKGVLLYHLLCAGAAAVLIATTWWLHFRRRNLAAPPSVQLTTVVELVGVFFVVLAGHLGGILSGVNS
jgi:uncharacterized membrane protein